MDIQNLSTQEVINLYRQLMAAQAGTNVGNVSNTSGATSTNNASQPVENVTTGEAVDNIENDPLYRYLSSKEADLNATIPTFSGYQYTSTPSSEAPLIPGSELVNPKDYVLGAVIIDEEVNELAGKLFTAHAANFSVNEWNAVVEQAIIANGGLGNGEDGFLAWSKDGHFVRLRNTNLTQEQNQKLAAYSLEFGWPVEDLPSGTSKDALTDEQFMEKINLKIADFDKKIEAFRQNPENDFTVRYGKRRFKTSYDPNTGYFASISYKVRSGFKGWVDRMYGKIQTGLGCISKVCKYAIPVYGPIISLCCKGVQDILGLYGAQESNGIYLNNK